MNKIENFLQMTAGHLKLYVTCLLLFVLSLSGHLVYAQEPEDNNLDSLKSYVSTIVKDSFDVLNDKNLNQSTKNNKIQKMIGDNLDLPKMIDFVLGIHRKTFTDQQKKEFSDAFSRYIIAFYSNALKLYDGQEIDVTNVLEQGTDQYLVKVSVTKNSSDKQLKIIYMVHKVGTQFKIFDVITENYSLLNNHRALFNDFMQHGGFERLMKEIKALESSLDK